MRAPEAAGQRQRGAAMMRSKGSRTLFPRDRRHGVEKRRVETVRTVIGLSLDDRASGSRAAAPRGNLNGLPGRADRGGGRSRHTACSAPNPRSTASSSFRRAITQDAPRASAAVRECRRRHHHGRDLLQALPSSVSSRAALMSTISIGGSFARRALRQARAASSPSTPLQPGARRLRRPTSSSRRRPPAQLRR